MAKSEYQGKGFETPVEDNPPFECDKNFTVPDKDPGRQLTKGKRLKGSEPNRGSKVRTFPSQR